MRRTALLAGLGLGLVGLSLWQAGEAATIHAKALLAQALLERAWARTLAGEAQAKPWPWADTWPLAVLEAPRLEKRVIVLAGASGRTLAFAPGHVDGSAPPGASGNSVIAGHRDTHFRFLERLRRGDEIRLRARDGARRSFRVTATQVVDSRDVRLDPAGDRPGLILVTCYPFDALRPGGPLRFLVFAEEAKGPGAQLPTAPHEPVAPGPPFVAGSRAGSHEDGPRAAVSNSPRGGAAISARRGDGGR